MHDVGKIVILVHPGSFFISAAAQVDPARMVLCEDRLDELLLDGDGLIVIDGFLSEDLPVMRQRHIQGLLSEHIAAGRIAKRLWGCDDGSEPYDGWMGCGAGVLEHDGQEDAARYLAQRLPKNAEYVLTGAWATADLPGSSGCVNSVAHALREAGFVNVTIDQSAVLDDWIYEEFHNEVCGKQALDAYAEP